MIYFKKFGCFLPGFSVLPVILAFIPVGSEYEPGDPRRCPAHLFADVLDIGVFFCLQDDLVVDMADNTPVS